MARTATEIENEMIAAQAAETSLAGLTSTSKTAIYRLWRKVVVYAHLVLEQLWDVKAAELEAIANTAQGGTDKWYANRSLEFQYGHSLSEKDGQLYYLVVDEAAQIIDYAAVKSANGQVTIKVAHSNAGVLEKLTAAQKVGFESYINDIKFAGTRTSIVSEDPDMVKTAITIYYDGKLLLADFKTSVETAINSYLNSIYFDGDFYVTKFTDAIQSVEGVEDLQITTLEIKPVGGSYTAVTRLYSPLSGYYKIDPAYPLATQITYIAQ